MYNRVIAGFNKRKEPKFLNEFKLRNRFVTEKTKKQTTKVYTLPTRKRKPR